MKKINIKKIKVLELNEALILLSKKGTPLSWSVVRTITKTEPEVPKYYHDINLFIQTFSEKDENDKPKLKEGKTGSFVTDFIFKNEEEAVKALQALQEELIEIDVYEAPKEKIVQYLSTNPAPDEYRLLIGNIINPELID